MHTPTRGDGFYNTTAGRSPDMVYGLFHCRGDLSTSDCQACVTFATTDISQRCPNQTTAVAWYDECLLRYSNRNIFSVVEDRPAVRLSNYRNATGTEIPFDQLVAATVVMNMNDITTQTENKPAGSKKFATRETKLSSSRTLYTLAQCTPDLSGSDCSICLQGALELLPTGWLGGRLLSPSCNVRYEIYPFYNPTIVSPQPPPAAEEEKQNKSNRIPVLVASLSAIFWLAVVFISGFFIRRRRNSRDEENSQEVQLLDLVNEHSRETFNGENGERSQEFPSIQLDVLHAATNHFSDENKLGQGGFGPVFKGTLANGKEIAVKRLSETSSQGLVEVKNEIMLIAKLQHRNLVRLLGCCLEKSEKLLVYEFMPNKSLDVFLFDSKLAAQLDWQKRFNIIKGIARGILYLHEDSSLKIIHRDLKASNVLLDHEMNPKISNFGMARIFEDQNEANTNRVVGTYGYMAPEYAMEGLFSIKYDVFSFGVLLLEIISGKKNNGFHHLEHGESLLTFAWKLWSKGEGMELIDQVLVPSCVASEVLKCIHIGLLCVQEDPADRPTMSSVIFMLASDSTITLLCPSEPAFFVGRAIAKPTEPISDDGVFSVNEVTISNFSPR
ncbi:cysteine-rich receptor-like protein kinase 10 isoform X1 [Gossypium raimondii]|uniref:cysteine-rich receptor-like protein kinase 10 isoform X1 n=1 Tax=Gossypium raimondii TaxID=29730 RepID=UPI00227C6D11|nr:cysteine-rich receptor-like protein kinase 10 isoform X1 [Gossypium raimondii]